MTDSEILVDGYSVLRNDRNRHGGGVCMFIRSDIAYNPRTDLDDENVRAVWCDISLPKSKPILVGTFYNPHRDSDFRTNFDKVLANINPGQETYMLGDDNICTGTDSCNCRSSSVTKSYLNLLSAAGGFKQIIDKPTRVTNESISCIIDHVICNFSNKVVHSGVLPIGVSDHYLVFCTRKQAKLTFNTHKTVTLRSMKNYSAEVFSRYLENCDWSSVLNCHCVNTAWSNFTLILNTVLDKVAPIRTVRIKQRTEPWMTSNILDMIRTRYNMRFRLDKGSSDVTYNEYLIT